MQAQIRHLEEQLHQEKNLSVTLHQSLEEEKRCNGKLSERNDRLTQQVTDQKSEIERLHQLLSHVQSNLEHYQISVQKLREEQTFSMEKQKSVYEQEIRSSKKEIAEIIASNNQLQRDCNQLHSEIEVIKEQFSTALSEKNLSHQQLQEKIISETTLKSNCDQLRQSCSDYQSKMEHKIEVIIELEKKQAVLINQLENLKKSFQNAQDTICILRDEKLYLIQEKANLEGQFKQLQTNLT